MFDVSELESRLKSKANGNQYETVVVSKCHANTVLVSRKSTRILKNTRFIQRKTKSRTFISFAKDPREGKVYFAI